MVWAFQSILSRQLFNMNDKAAFQAEVYEKINPKTAKAVIAETHFPNCTMHKISNLFNCMTTYVLISNYIDKDIMTFEDTCGWCEYIISSSVPLFYTHHTACLLTVWKILLPFGLYTSFQGSWNQVAMISLVTAIFILLFGIEEFVVQLEKFFSIFPI